jgi:hypothetical protein
MELHDRNREGCTDALNAFLTSDCGSNFSLVTITGEYKLFCQTGWKQLPDGLAPYKRTG